jgi:hypothetical protein
LIAVITSVACIVWLHLLGGGRHRKRLQNGSAAAAKSIMIGQVTIPWECSVKHVLWLACAFSLLAFAQTGRAGEQVPNLNIELGCGDARDMEHRLGSNLGASTSPDDLEGQTYKSCLADENDARKALIEKWSTYKAGTRRTCVEAGRYPNPSYVELLTCLEMFNNELLPPSDKSNDAAPKQ